MLSGNFQRIFACLLLATFSPAAHAARAVPPQSGLFDFRGAIHVHSERSHDCPSSFAELAAAAESIGLDFVFLTDHFPFAKAVPIEPLSPGGKTLFIPGIEIARGRNTVLSNSVLGIGVLPDYRPSEPENIPLLIEKIHQGGGLAVAAHSLGFTHWDLPIDAMEIYNLADNMLPHSRLGWIRKAPGYLWRFFKIFFGMATPSETLISLLERPDAHLSLWDRELEKRKLIGVGSPNSHQNVRILGRQLDPYAQTLRSPSLHLLAKELKADSLLKALKEGRAYTGFDLLADSSGFRFYALDPKTGARHPQGSEIPFTWRLLLKVEVPAAKEGLRARIALLRNGEKITRIEHETLHWTVYRPGIYRVEAELWSQGRWAPWIYSNPIYVR